MNEIKPAALIGLSLVICTLIGSFVFYAVKSTDSLEVTGSAKKTIISDFSKWTGEFTRTVTVSQLNNGYKQMAADQEKVVSFLKSERIAEEDYTVFPVSMYEVYKDPSLQTEKEYTLRQTVEIRSSDIQKITALASKAQVLTEKGVIFSTLSVEYYYTKLADLRVSLLSEAVQDAKNRATEIAKSGNRQIGSLQAASSGVVQLMPVNSIDVSDYGTYDTTHIEKEVMVSVRANFKLK